MEELFALVPFIDLPDLTAQAIDDLLAQENVHVRVLGISNGSSAETRAELETRQLAPAWKGRVLFWWHHPALPTLDATWNAALDFVWQAGGERALVVNNDVRLARETVSLLLSVLDGEYADAPEEPAPLFVSAIGVRPAMPDPYTYDLTSRGGPDFSCFLITRECAEKYRFDESFTYVGDCDTHRRMMLGGDAARIFSVNVPYLHYASQTITRATPEKRAHYERMADRHRERYAQKWGGGVNSERFRVPFDPESAEEGITNPELQARG